ncbi:UNVERIFIED_ORG: 5'-methylthioadenosine/S-adenosylhomocysteine nucleosidase [Roseateles sp. XES5]|uniref:5'-methylthioadenosine/S-adenosylhomocysteine nucleosidase n=1 Tax=Shinella sp. G-2 TaxID=3133141 RepID=UPI001D00593C|nr:5'-methylthioadenosine/S-adenosylhomocysteine nucleosidase [Roseateles sp. XES5]
MSFTLKTVGSKRILYVMAADAEYGPHLKARIAPFMTGVGPVEAAVQLTLALCHLEAEGNLPDYVVSLGSAGSATLEQTGVYQATSVSYRDMDASPLGFTKGATPFLDQPAEIALPCSIPGIAKARLSTGANIVSGAAYATIDADMVEMETYAELRACQAFNVPLIGLRGISDGKAELTHIGDWTEYLHVIDEKLADAVDALESAIASSTIARNG